MLLQTISQVLPDGLAIEHNSALWILGCSSVPQPVARMMDVGRQSNGSDCGVLAITFAYDVCSGTDPCTVRFDRNKSIRLHLADYLEKHCLLHFPVVGEQKSAGVKMTQTVNLHCSCRLPEVRGDKMAKCDICLKYGTTNTAWTFQVMF